MVPEDRDVDVVRQDVDDPPFDVLIDGRAHSGGKNYRTFFSL
jgi:hypothetical protein